MSMRPVRSTSVVIIEGHKPVEWSEAYQKAGFANVAIATFDQLDEVVSQQGEFDPSHRVIHVTAGVPADSLYEAQRSVEAIAKYANFVVFTPKPNSFQLNESLMISWPSFWGILFLVENFCLFDPIRPAVWNESFSDWDTMQSTVVFARNKEIQAENNLSSLVDYVHPSIVEMNLKKIARLEDIILRGSSIPVNASRDIYFYLPKRYRSKKYELKIVKEQRKWWFVALCSPWRFSYWNDLWRVQRRRKRLNNVS